MIRSQPRGKNQDVTGISKERGYFSRQKVVLEMKDPHSAHVKMVRRRKRCIYTILPGGPSLFLQLFRRQSRPITTRSEKETSALPLYRKQK